MNTTDNAGIADDTDVADGTGVAGLDATTGRTQSADAKGVVVLGTTDFVMGFALAGVRTSLVTRKNELLNAINSNVDAGIVIVDEDIAEDLPQKKRDELETSISPIIIFLGRDESKITGRLKKNIKSTLGVDLLKEIADNGLAENR